METKSIISFLVIASILASCDEKKESSPRLTQALCENQNTRADCEAAGCTYTCGMVLRRNSDENGWECISRRKVGRCVAVVRLIEEENNNQDYFYSIDPNSSAWLLDEVVDYSIGMSVNRYLEYFKVDNQRDYPVQVLGHRSYTLEIDPCYGDDPNETLYPWEGSCETDWWSEDMWDDVLPE